MEHIIVWLRRYIASCNSRYGARLDPVALAQKSDFNCRWCGDALEPGKVNLDHLIPRSRGGTSEDANLVLSCAPCNAMKHDRTPIEFLFACARIIAQQAARFIGAKPREKKPTRAPQVVAAELERLSAERKPDVTLTVHCPSCGRYLGFCGFWGRELRVHLKCKCGSDVLLLVENGRPVFVLN